MPEKEYTQSNKVLAYTLFLRKPIRQQSKLQTHCETGGLTPGSQSIPYSAHGCVAHFGVCGLPYKKLFKFVFRGIQFSITAKKFLHLRATQMSVITRDNRHAQVLRIHS